MKKKLKKLEKRVELLESIINATQDKVVIVKDDEVIDTKPTFKPVFMKCTQEQFDRMRPKLESVGCCILGDENFNNLSYLTNNYALKEKRISTITITSPFRNYSTEVYTEAEFLEACGYVEEKIEYTLENIQVDCRELSDEQVKEMHSVVVGKGFRSWDDFSGARYYDGLYMFRYIEKNGAIGFFVVEEDISKHTITYEKFMELFSEKPIEEEQKTVRISDLPVRNIEELHAEHKEAKREPKVGDVVKAWDDDKYKFVYGVLEGINTLLTCPYEIGETLFKNIELVTEININDFKREKN